MTGSIHKYSQVYYAENLDGKEINPVAIRPEIRPNVVFWEDTSRGRMVKGTTILNEAVLGDAPPDVIEIASDREGRFRLEKLTKDVYDSKVKRRVAGSPDFASTEAIQEYYLTTNFEY